MFSEAAMAEPWDGVGKAAMAGNHKAQGGLLGGCDAHAGGETSVGMYKLDETIEKSCSDLLAIHQRQCIFGKMEIF
jgi:hypothetical protein